jgi:ADP-ribose pyrophosphatase
MREIYKGPIFDLIQETMEINGKPVLRDIIVHPGGVCGCCVKDGNILLVRQTRAAARQKTLEIPAGLIEPHESYEEALQREINEETGYEFTRSKLISHFYPTPGYDSEVIHLYACSGLHEAAHKLSQDPDEDVERLWMPIQDAYAKIETGEILDAKTIIAIYYVLLHPHFFEDNQ